MIPSILPGESDAPAILERELADRFNRMDRLLACAFALISSGGIRMTKPRGITQLVLMVVMGLYVKSLKTFRMIRLVCMNGNGEAAHALARVLFETMSAIVFILRKASHERAVMYMAYTSFQQQKALNAWKQTKGLKRWATKRLVRDVQEKLASAEQVLGPEKMRKVRDHWSGTPSLEQALKTLRLGKAYQVFYRIACLFSHPQDAAHHLTIEGEDRIVLRFDPNLRLIAQAMDSSCAFLWICADCINRRLGSGLDAELAELEPKKFVVPLPPVAPSS